MKPKLCIVQLIAKLSVYPVEQLRSDRIPLGKQHYYIPVLHCTLTTINIKINLQHTAAQLPIQRILLCLRGRYIHNF